MDNFDKMVVVSNEGGIVPLSKFNEMTSQERRDLRGDVLLNIDFIRRVKTYKRDNDDNKQYSWLAVQLDTDITYLVTALDVQDMRSQFDTARNRNQHFILMQGFEVDADK